MEVTILESQALSAILSGITGFASYGKVPANGAIDASNLGGGFPMAANGGDISGPTIVGEKGPELFVPRGSGTVIPIHMLGSIGGPTININSTLHVDSGTNDAQFQSAM